MPKCCDPGSVRSDITLKVSGMSCGHCKEAVERSIGVLPGVSRVEVNVKAGKVEISYKPYEANLDDIIQAVKDAGYDVED
ncbi:MAG TPA: heavy-metal-associated domain-containing protein [Thermoanaerobacterales bacterium]|nr:heavy-metal-associated domain-containing protein [Thermoanaerobacterales bacterium]